MAPAALLTESEIEQLTQTIEMFEVITQSQPQDYQSLEILKEAYFKLGREAELIDTSKRIAQAYVQMGQLSSAILEYESILQRCPDDKEAAAALQEIESKATGLSSHDTIPNVSHAAPEHTEIRSKSAYKPSAPSQMDDGYDSMYKIFVTPKIIAEQEFKDAWIKTDWSSPPVKPVDPFIQNLSINSGVPLEKSMKVISDKFRLGYFPLDRYDIDIELARSFPVETCLRWCVLPFDRMSKSVFVATANPFNRQAAKELEIATKQRIVWYLSPPPEISRALQKVFRINS